MDRVHMGDGRWVTLDPNQLHVINRFVIANAEGCIRLAFITDDGTTLECVAQVGLPTERIASFVKSLVALAEEKQIAWEETEAREMPKPPKPH